MGVRHLALPSETAWRERLQTSHLSHSGVTPQTSGARIGRSYWPRPRLAYSGALRVAADDTQEMSELWALQHHLEGMAGAIWVRHPISRQWQAIKTYPTGDATAKAFVIPFHEHAGTPYLYKDEGSGRRHLTLSYYASRANLIVDDDEAWLAEGAGSLTGVNLGGGSIARTDLHAHFGTHCLQVTPSGSQTNYGAQTSNNDSDITAGRTYTGMGWVKSSVTPFRARIYWYDSGGSPCSPAYTEGSSIAVDWNWTCVYVTGAASTAATQAAVQILHYGTSDASFWVDCFGLTDLESPYWWPPSMCPGVGVVASAPAADAVMEAGGTGYRLTRCQLDTDDFADQLDNVGNDTVTLDLTEAWEDWT